MSSAEQRLKALTLMKVSGAASRLKVAGESDPREGGRQLGPPPLLRPDGYE